MDSTPMKTFCCKTSGCGINFINETQLNLHEKKHQMVLNIENKVSNVFLADQTPTPTRLIKNCEEVGLFDDLRNVNPFDETFRRAVETKSNLESGGHQHLQQKNSELLLNEDTLHTPQVFPNTEDPTNITHEFQVEKQKIVLSANLDKKRTVVAKISDDNILKPTKRQKSLTEIVLISNATKTKNIRPSTDCLIIAPSSGKRNAISLVQPKSITWQTSKTLILPKPTTISTSQKLCESPISIKDKLKTILINNQESHETHGNHQLRFRSPTESSFKCKQDSKNPDDDCMERRRAAATRYRKKKHLELCDLQKQNSQLLHENLELKSTIKELQEVLLAHSNCDLTQTTLKNSPNGITAQLLIKSMPAISIPASTIVMNIPKLIIQPNTILNSSSDIK